jgi:hypothetical protein
VARSGDRVLLCDDLVQNFQQKARYLARRSGNATCSYFSAGDDKLLKTGRAVVSGEGVSLCLGKARRLKCTVCSVQLSVGL